MDRCALFVDAGYLLAEGGALCLGTKRRAEIDCEYASLVPALANYAKTHCGLPVLRTYWYDGSRDGVPTFEHLRVAELPNVKLRLGRLSGGRQKGVDSLILRDLMTLARERAMATAYLVGGDEDLREGVIAAQDMGVPVVVLGIPTAIGNQAPTLTREADEHLVLEAAFWHPYFRRVGVRQPELLTERGVPAGEVIAAQSPGIRDQDRATAEVANARELGLGFARDWGNLASSERVRDLLSQAPRIPTSLDAQLLRRAEDVLGSLRERETLRKDLRAGFWAGLRLFAEST